MLYFKIIFPGFVALQFSLQLASFDKLSCSLFHKQGRRRNFKSGGTNITASEASRKIWGLYPHIWHSGGTTAAKRHTESLSASVTQGYACYNISYWSCIYRPI